VKQPNRLFPKDVPVYFRVFGFVIFTGLSIHEFHPLPLKQADVIVLKKIEIEAILFNLKFVDGALTQFGS